METIFIRHSSEHKASENGKKMQDTSPYALKRCNMAIWTRFDEHNLKFAEKMEIWWCHTGDLFIWHLSELKTSDNFQNKNPQI